MLMACELWVWAIVVTAGLLLVLMALQTSQGMLSRSFARRPVPPSGPDAAAHPLSAAEGTLARADNEVPSLPVLGSR